VAALWVGQGRIRPGSAGLAVAVGDEVVPMLTELARRGVRAAVFEGIGA